MKRMRFRPPSARNLLGSKEQEKEKNHALRAVTMTVLCTSVLKVHYTVLPMFLKLRFRRTRGEQRFKTNLGEQMCNVSEGQEENEIVIFNLFSLFFHSTNPIYLCNQ